MVKNDYQGNLDGLQKFFDDLDLVITEGYKKEDKPKIVEIAQMLIAKNYAIVATRGTAKVLESAGIACEVVYKVNEGRPNTVDMIKNDQIQLIFNTTEGVKAVADSFTMRREALQHHVTYYTTMAGAKAACYALGELDAGDVNCLQDLHKEFH